MNQTAAPDQGSAHLKAFRWVVLILVSIVIGTNYYVYDAMSSIKQPLQDAFNFDNTQYGILVSFYSFTNTFLLMSLIGGIILDKWGIRKTGFMFVTMCSIGALTTAYGASDMYHEGGFGYSFMSSFLPDYSPELKMMMLGRLLFGLGAETSIVVINKILVKWFKGKELSTAFAINIAIARIGTAMALIFSPILIKAETGWTMALWVAALLMGVGLVFFIVYMAYDKKADKIIGNIKLRTSEDEFHLSDLVDLLKNKSFIYIIFLCVTFYSAVFPFQSFCPDLLHNKFGLSLENSGWLTSLIIWGTIIFTPLFGFLVDKKGRRASLMFLGSFLLVVVHLILSLTHITPYLAMFTLGIAFSLVPAAMWPSVALIVEEKRLGTAYGLMASLQNLGLWGFPILAGFILDQSNPGITAEMVADKEAVFDYTYTVLMFAGLGFVGFLFAYLLKRNDAKEGNNILERPVT